MLFCFNQSYCNSYNTIWRSIICDLYYMMWIRPWVPDLLQMIKKETVIHNGNLFFCYLWSHFQHYWSPFLSLVLVTNQSPVIRQWNDSGMKLFYFTYIWFDIYKRTIAYILNIKQYNLNSKTNNISIIPDWVIIIENYPDFNFILVCWRKDNPQKCN